MYGSTYGTLKQAILTRLAAVNALSGVSISGNPPVDPLNVTGSDGSGRAIWISDAEGAYDNVVMCGQARLDIEEVYDLNITFQALQRDTGDTQVASDLRVDTMLYAFLEDMADDITFGVAASSDLPLVYITVSRGSFRRLVGPITGTNKMPSACVLSLHVEARISFT